MHAKAALPSLAIILTAPLTLAQPANPTPHPTPRETPHETAESLLAPYVSPDTPGAVIAVIDDGSIIYEAAVGAANLTYGIPYTLDTPTNIGSTSKHFTAFALCLLEEQGKLSLDDDVRDHLTSLKDFGTPITIRNLLTHTTGYREFLNALLLTGRRMDLGDGIERREIFDLINNQPELQNEPGAEFNYNNSGYAIAAEIVSRVGKRPFHLWMRENVFLPLGMTNTHVRPDPLTIIEDAAAGYIPGPQGTFTIAKDLGGAMGAGGIYSTPRDLARWIDNFSDPTLGSPAIFEKMTTINYFTAGDNKGEPINYGLGLFIDEFQSEPRVQHGGADTAHRAMLVYFPKLDAGVVALSNHAAFNSTQTADALAAAFFANELAENETTDTAEATDANPSEFNPDNFKPETFDAMAGRYELDIQPGFVLEFGRDGDSFWTQATGQPKIEIFPTSPTDFELRVVEASVTFNADDNGNYTSVTLHQNGHHNATRVADEAWKPSAADFAAYAGRYYSEELDTFYTVLTDAETVVVTHRRFRVALQPASPDNFTGNQIIGEAEFERDADGTITALIVANSRTRDVRFDKVN